MAWRRRKSFTIHSPPVEGVDATCGAVSAAVACESDAVVVCGVVCAAVVAATSVTDVGVTFSDACPSAMLLTAFSLEARPARPRERFLPLVPGGAVAAVVGASVLECAGTVRVRRWTR